MIFIFLWFYDELVEYNVIMLFDFNLDEFNEEWIGVLKCYCNEKVGGVFYMVGFKYISDFLNFN